MAGGQAKYGWDGQARQAGGWVGGGGGFHPPGLTVTQVESVWPHTKKTSGPLGIVTHILIHANTTARKTHAEAGRRRPGCVDGGGWAPVKPAKKRC